MKAGAQRIGHVEAKGRALRGVAERADGDEHRARAAGGGEHLRAARQPRGGAAAKGLFDQPPAQRRQPQRGRGQRQHHPGVRRAQAANARKGKERLVPQIGRVADQPHRHHGPPGQRPRHLPAGAREEHDQRRAAHRGERPERGKGRGLVEDGHRAEDQRQPEPRQRVVAGQRAPVQRQRAERADHQLPGAGRQQVEVRRRRGMRGILAQQQAGRGQPKQDPQQPRLAPAPPDQQQKQREEDVELLLHREAPGVQERLFLGGGGEIAAFLPEQDVGGENAHRDQAAREIAERLGPHPHPGKGEAAGHHNHQRRQDAARAALPEAPRRDPPLAPSRAEMIAVMR